jgi:hypothetical protein
MKSDMTYAALALVIVAGAAVDIGLKPAALNFVQPAIAQSSGSSVGYGDRQKYMDEHRGQFQQWGKRVDDFNSKAAANANAATEGARAELNRAWIDVKSGWARLQNASEFSFGEAKASFEARWRKLQQAWNKAQS